MLCIRIYLYCCVVILCILNIKYIKYLINNKYIKTMLVSTTFQLLARISSGSS